MAKKKAEQRTLLVWCDEDGEPDLVSAELLLDDDTLESRAIVETRKNGWTRSGETGCVMVFKLWSVFDVYFDDRLNAVGLRIK